MILLAALVVLLAPLGTLAPASAATCSDPAFVTSDANGWYVRA